MDRFVTAILAVLAILHSNAVVAEEDYVVVFSTAAACAAHDMNQAHLILKPPSGSHDAVASSCDPACGGTAMGFVSAHCISNLLASARGPMMKLYNTESGCAGDVESDIVRIDFNLNNCFTISNGDSLTILSSGTDEEEVCSIRMDCGGTSATLSGYGSEDCTGQTVSTHTAGDGECVQMPGMGYTKYACPVAQAAEVQAETTTTPTPTKEAPVKNVQYGILGASLVVMGLVLVISNAMMKK